MSIAPNVDMKFLKRISSMLILILFIFLTMSSDLSHAHFLCNQIGQIEASISQGIESKKIKIQFGKEELTIDYFEESRRLLRISRDLLPFELAMFDKPEKHWPKSQRPTVRQFFELSVSHESRASFFHQFLALAGKEISQNGTISEQKSFQKSRIVPLRFIESVLEQFAARFGFSIMKISEKITDEKFQELVKSGVLIHDGFFADDDHGAYTHIFQVLHIANSLDSLHGHGHTVEIYKSIGSDKRFSIWRRYFDDSIGSSFSPENFSEVLRKYFRNKLL
jgi:hypothetical protein